METKIIVKLAKVLTLSELQGSLKNQKELTIRGLSKGQDSLTVKVVISEIEEREDRIYFKGKTVKTKALISECSGMVLKGTRLGAKIEATERLRFKSS